MQSINWAAVTTDTWQLRSHKGRSYDLLMFSKNDSYDQLFGIKTCLLWPNLAAPSQLLQWKLKVAYYPVYVIVPVDIAASWWYPRLFGLAVFGRRHIGW